MIKMLREKFSLNVRRRRSGFICTDAYTGIDKENIQVFEAVMERFGFLVAVEATTDYGDHNNVYSAIEELEGIEAMVEQESFSSGS